MSDLKAALLQQYGRRYMCAEKFISTATNESFSNSQES